MKPIIEPAPRRMCVGNEGRLHIASTAQVWNAFVNTNSGEVTFEAWSFVGYEAAFITGGHAVECFGEKRQHAVPSAGRDIVVKEGAWIGSRAIVLGPCVVGEHSVVGAGAVVSKDVPPYAVVVGNPAEVTRYLQP